jgi:hypothetical protein
MSNIFQRISASEQENDFKLGMPSTDEAHHARRLTVMETLTGGKGFRIPAKEPAIRGNGKTRGEAKREARAAADAKVSEYRDRQFRHSSARNVEFVTMRAAA